MSKSIKSSPPKSFEAALSELESLVTGMETGTLSLEDALAAYQRGMLLTGFCQKALADAEQQVKLLENGQLTEFDPSAGPSDDAP
ncbi:MAG: exodeoxyribonuclease VII small subunit [Pseudomonadota bacterium]